MKQSLHHKQSLTQTNDIPLRELAEHRIVTRSGRLVYVRPVNKKSSKRKVSNKKTQENALSILSEEEIDAILDEYF
jgi:hypothetical protein